MINGKLETERKSSLEWMKGGSTKANTLDIQTPMMKMMKILDTIGQEEHTIAYKHQVL